MNSAPANGVFLLSLSTFIISRFPRPLVADPPPEPEDIRTSIVSVVSVFVTVNLLPVIFALLLTFSLSSALINERYSKI